jgi:hypothetical protein
MALDAVLTVLLAKLCYTLIMPIKLMFLIIVSHTVRLLCASSPSNYGHIYFFKV